MSRSRLSPSVRPVVPWCGQVDRVPRDAVTLSVPARVAWLPDAQRGTRRFLSSAAHPSCELEAAGRPGLERLPADAFMHLLVLTDR
jgi:hypothetical protein